jgi:hypothetical protein
LVIEEVVNATMTLLPWSDDKVEMEPDRPRKKEAQAGFAHLKLLLTLLHAIAKPNPQGLHYQNIKQHNMIFYSIVSFYISIVQSNILVRVKCPCREVV